MSLEDPNLLIPPEKEVARVGVGGKFFMASDATPIIEYTMSVLR